MGFTKCYTTWGTQLYIHVLKNYTHITLGACHSRMSDYMYVRNGKSRAFATIEKITETQLRFFLEVFKCRNLLSTDILRQIVLLPASLQLQIVHRYCDFVFGTLNMYAMTL